MSIYMLLDRHRNRDTNQAYIDRPLPIGWNTTISAPHMHAMTLEHLAKFLKPGGRAIDIGCGSGYLTAVMGIAVGKKGKVVGVDHIEEICEYSKSNIMKEHSYLIKEKRVIFITMDGRKGLPKYGPFHVIHVGASIEEVPEEFTEQLALGGRMWIPVGR